MPQVTNRIRSYLFKSTRMITQAFLYSYTRSRSCFRLMSEANRSSRVISTLPTPEMPKCNFTPEPYSGLPMKRIMEIRKTCLSPTVKATYSKPVLLSQGKMQWLWDHEGRRYLDMFGGIVTVSVGHCHPEVSKSVKTQMGKLWHTTQLYMNSPIHEYAEKLASTMPGNLKMCFFTNSGSEANDLAMILAREYTKAFDIISFRNAYHGGSPYTVGLTAHGTWKHGYANGFGIHHSVNPDPYKGIWGGSNCRDSLVQPDRPCACADGECQAGEFYLSQLQEVLDHSVGKRPAALFAEGIQGVGGVVQFPKGFLKKAFAMVRERGGLCIADEVQTGFGRLGSHMWGFESHGVMPDIVTMAKGVANGFPFGALVTTPEVVKAIADVNHLNTFAGNPLSTTAASKVLDVIKEEKLQENSRKLGDYFILELSKLRNEYPIVGDVRGKGLMLGIELVESKESRKPLNAQGLMIIKESIKEMGIIMGAGGLHVNTLRIKPPMCITKEDVDFTIAVVTKAIHDYCESKH